MEILVTSTTSVTFEESAILKIEVEIQELLGVEPFKVFLEEHDDTTDKYELEFIWKSSKADERGNNECSLSIDRSTSTIYVTDFSFNTGGYDLNQQGYDALIKYLKADLM